MNEIASMLQRIDRRDKERVAKLTERFAAMSDSDVAAVEDTIGEIIYGAKVLYERGRVDLLKEWTKSDLGFKADYAARFLARH